MKKNYTITIGIPAYNEEANIGHLIKDLLRQKQENFTIEKIIVSSDGSTDDSKNIVRQSKNKKIIFLDNRQRKGTSVRQNQLIRFSRSDILVLINADIVLNHPLFLKNLIDPIIKKNADLTSCRVQATKPKSFLSRILDVSLLCKNYIFEHYKSGNNVYTCHGVARAFSKRLYSKLRFKESIAEDAYSYLFCVYHNFTYEYVERATALIKLPENLTDHYTQSTRFFLSQKYLYEDFGKAFVDKNYHLPLKFTLASFISFGIKYPVYIFLFVIVAIYMKFRSFFMRHENGVWDIAKSSKTVRLVI